MNTEGRRRLGERVVEVVIGAILFGAALVVVIAFVAIAILSGLGGGG
jgi:hypothetical protein